MSGFALVALAALLRPTLMGSFRESRRAHGLVSLKVPEFEGQAGSLFVPTTVWLCLTETA